MPDAQNQHISLGTRREQILRECGADPRRIADRLMSLEEQLEAAQKELRENDRLVERAWQERDDETEKAKRAEEQLEAFQELAQDAASITTIGHGFELDVPVNLGSFKWVEAATHLLDTMASLASNPASESEGTYHVRMQPDAEPEEHSAEGVPSESPASSPATGAGIASSSTQSEDGPEGNEGRPAPVPATEASERATGTSGRATAQPMSAGATAEGQVSATVTRSEASDPASTPDVPKDGTDA